MFREMRRKKQALADETCQEVLNRGTSGVLAVSGDDGYPYAVPMSYVYNGEKIYFHSAFEGHKIDSIARNHKVSFSVIDQDQVVSREYTTYFRSVIAFGTIRVVSDAQEKRKAIETLAAKYSPGESEERTGQAIEREWAQLCILELSIEHLSGKEAIELVKKKSEIKCEA